MRVHLFKAFLNQAEIVTPLRADERDEINPMEPGVALLAR